MFVKQSIVDSGREFSSQDLSSNEFQYNTSLVVAAQESPFFGSFIKA
jgi:hypothetical protein